MCGIVGYIGTREAYRILINGLKRLEYRGYDSAGIALIQNDSPTVYRCKGKVSDLEAHIGSDDKGGIIGMGHTRWATHGEPCDRNSHPHTSNNGHFVLIHNGIIENYARLRKRLEDRGYVFHSDTDTEVLANLIEYIYIKGATTAEVAVRTALTKVVGAYGLVIMCKNEPNQLIAARKGSPLVIGVGKGEYFIASDATPIVEYTDRVIYLNDDDVAVVKRNELSLKTVMSDAELIPEIKKVELELDEIEKGGFEHFMLKEIYEQPRTILDTLRGRVSVSLP